MHAGRGRRTPSSSSSTRPGASEYGSSSRGGDRRTAGRGRGGHQVSKSPGQTYSQPSSQGPVQSQSCSLNQRDARSRDSFLRELAGAGAAYAGFKGIPACSQHICKEIAIALKNNKPWAAWQGLFRLNLSLGDADKVSLIDRLTHEVITKLLDFNFLSSRAHHDEVSLGELFLLQLLPSCLLTHHFKNEIEQKYHHFGGILFMDRIEELRQKSLRIPEGQQTPEGQEVCDGYVELLALWRPVLSQARLNAIAPAFARLLKPAKIKLVQQGIKEDYWESLQGVMKLLPLMDAYDKCDERGAAAFRGSCLTALNKALNKLPDQIVDNPDATASQALFLLRSVLISKAYRWQTDDACWNQEAFLLKIWPAVKGFPKEGIHIAVPDVPEGGLESGWNELVKNMKTRGSMTFGCEREVKSTVVQCRNAGDVLSCFIITSQLLKKYPQCFDPKICRVQFEIFDAALEAVSSTLLLDCELTTANQITTRNALLWLNRILGDWCGDALMLSQKSRWALERLNMRVYQKQIAPLLEKASAQPTKELQMKECLRLESLYNSIIPHVKHRALEQHVTGLLPKCNREQLAQSLPEASDRAVRRLLGDAVADEFKALRASKPTPVSEPVTVSKPSNKDAECPDNQAFAGEIRQLAKQNRYSEAVNQLLKAENFDFSSQDGLELYRQLCHEVIEVVEVAARDSASDKMSSETEMLIRQCQILADGENADLPDLQETLSRLLPTEVARKKNSSNFVGKDYVVQRPTPRRGFGRNGRGRH
ncbi:hypothetical protein [Parendozoicomonas haliclonae]|uniref:Uncharacterized protein n=1 Tax=Parendozoicomonas haliclonae TaxID=1960125 RepID=A0A1X7ALE5_9GAMM|nr:hypothetical protein [Parendozoicomonas haliclonae]SMA48315.1 hypothetical protein EHSB41UT_02690 [Parendozoicomonas haliclonae]